MPTKNTHELSEGDVVSYHGCQFRLREKKVYTRPHDLQYDPKGTATFKTDLVTFKPGSMPKSWAETWTIQGNSHAFWLVE